MTGPIEKTLGSVSLIAILSFAFSLNFAVAPAQAANAERFLGGPKGLVKNDQGVPLEGMGVQLISDRSAIRTTVYSNQDGRYEFPKLESGTYTFRIAPPRVPALRRRRSRSTVRRRWSIQLTRVTKLRLCRRPARSRPRSPGRNGSPAFRHRRGQEAADPELQFLPFLSADFPQPLRRAWLGADRRPHDPWRRLAADPDAPRRPLQRRVGSAIGEMARDRARTNVPDPSFVTLPRPQGRATRVVITEYELPRSSSPPMT